MTATPPSGTVCATMEMGHVVLARVLSDVGDEHGYIECEFICHQQTGKERLCLDFGQDWWIERGERFWCHPKGFQSAADSIMKRGS